MKCPRRALAAAASCGFAVAAAGSPEIERCGASEASWLPAPVALEGAPIDLRELAPGPAGAHGFVRARGEDLVFGDGTPARFFGTNVAAGALFGSTNEEIDLHAERIAKLGFNLVRLHHHDANGWVARTLIASSPGTAELDGAALAKFDRWAAQLRRQGVYLWLDLHTSRVFREGDDIPGFEEITRSGGQRGAIGKGFLYLNARLEALVLDFAARLLEHLNPYTGLRYRDDPALAAVLVTNENDLVHHFGNRLSDAANPWHRTRFEQQAAEFAARTKLPARLLRRTWEPGPSKLLLADLEHNFDSRARARLRAEGVRVPIALTSFWNENPLSALASLSRGDFVDAHSYGMGNVLEGDPAARGGMVARISAAQLAGLPVTVSEWNAGDPLQKERYGVPLWISSVGALQGWDALLLYAYAHRPVGHLGRSSPWSSAADPSVIALAPAAALMYRRGDVQPALKRYVLQPPASDVWERDRTAAETRALSTLAEQSRVSIALPAQRTLPWLRSEPARGDVRVPDLDRSFLVPGASRITSDNGQLQRDFVRGWQTIDTARTQAAAGRIAAQTITLGDVQLRPESDGAVVFSSLDGRPLARSRRVLLTVVARSCPIAGRGSAYAMEPMRGAATFRPDSARVLIPLDGSGRRGAPVRLRAGARGSEISLTLAGPWALLEPDGDAR